MNRLLAATAIALIFRAGGATAQDDRVLIFTDYDRIPETLREFAAGADAIIVARVESLDYRSGGTDVTDYRLQVVYALKPNPNLPTTSEVFVLTRKGGQHIENGRIIRTITVGFDEFRRGAEYVLFLSRIGRSTFDVYYGPWGTFELPESGIIRAGLPKHNARTRNEFLEELRTAIKP